jgi:hypothetical protein
MSFFEGIDSFFVGIPPEQPKEILATKEPEEEFYSFDPLLLFKELETKDPAIKKRMSFISSNLGLLSNYLRFHADFSFVPTPVVVQETPQERLDKANYLKFFGQVFNLSNGSSGKGILI